MEFTGSGESSSGVLPSASLAHIRLNPAYESCAIGTAPLSNHNHQDFRNVRPVLGSTRVSRLLSCSHRATFIDYSTVHGCPQSPAASCDASGCVCANQPGTVSTTTSTDFPARPRRTKGASEASSLREKRCQVRRAWAALGSAGRPSFGNRTSSKG